jgi:hypothetical protein
MNTKITCRKIAKLLYLTDDEINSQEALLLTKHLESCTSCKNAREDFLATRKITLQLDKGIPVYPDFIKSTEIMIKSGKTFLIARPSQAVHPIRYNFFSIIRYASSIAVLFLLVLFIWEQTLSIQKISMLEKRIQSTVNPPSPGLIDRITIARAAFTDKELNGLALNLGINKSGLDPNNLLRSKLFLEKRIRLEKTNELAYINLFLTSWTVKRNTMTFKNLIK